MQLCAHHQDTGIFHSLWVAVWSAAAETCREVEINMLGSSVHVVGFVSKGLYGNAGQQDIKNLKNVVMGFLFSLSTCLLVG